MAVRVVTIRKLTDSSPPFPLLGGREKMGFERFLESFSENAVFVTLSKSSHFFFFNVTIDNKQKLCNGAEME